MHKILATTPFGNIPRSTGGLFAASLFLVGFLLLQPSAAGQFPFPRDRNYAHGIRSTLADHSGKDLQSAYQSWLANNYREREGRACVCNTGARNTNEVTFHSSELAYGMLIMVYMDNPTNNTKPLFDRLLASYDHWLDPNGLMNWEIYRTGDSAHVKHPRDTVLGTYAATDADMDAAFSLLLAFRQWGDSTYLVRAKDLIGRIWKWEVDSTGNLKPGDNWDPYKNPSYLNFAAMHLFAKVDTNDWAKVLANSWALLQANTSAANTSARLPSDWCAPDGTPVKGMSNLEFHADAMRVPFRVGLAWSWFGDGGAGPIDSAIAAFSLSSSYSIQGRPDSITYVYLLDGRPDGWPYSSFMLGAFTAAGMVSPKFQAWVDTGYSRLRGQSNYSAYLGSLNMLELLYMSGNFNDLWDEVPTTALRTASRRTPLRIWTEGGYTALRISDGSLASVAIHTLQGRRLEVPVSVRGADTRLMDTRALPFGAYLVSWTAKDRTGAVVLEIGNNP